ncbi:CLUMA_CG018558, isoform A [Clunio marinus]|uniref:CLUMA_CG018558, isoform A n=1 Tax=Clunio marinus TaxID=568069 RepID=A0A1J1IZH0_9DIPT|nr:CLUMA_CG018558, isoform A [Clunio marinus]
MAMENQSVRFNIEILSNQHHLRGESERHNHSSYLQTQLNFLFAAFKGVQCQQHVFMIGLDSFEQSQIVTLWKTEPSRKEATYLHTWQALRQMIRMWVL